MDSRFIFVTGGVVSSLGKGISAASLGKILISRGLKVSAMKLDPYINVDPGTMSPYQHGEVYVTEDGSETDLDLGHYERMMDVNLDKGSNATTGKIYANVIAKERKGDYLGATVQVIPHITEEIKSRIFTQAERKDVDVLIVEIGGTVGDIESQPFLEAIRQIKRELEPNRAIFIHLTLVPYLEKAGELKTKPSQHSVKQLREIGISPDLLICRSEVELPQDVKEKLSLFCNLDVERIIENKDLDSIYEIPLNLKEQKIDDIVLKDLKLEAKDADLESWFELVEKEKNLKETIKIAIVGKYIELKDAYLSLAEALKHASLANNLELDIKWINSSEINKDNVSSLLGDVSGVVIPGGFGGRGIEGMILAANYARTNEISCLGICLGLHVMSIEFARNVLGLGGASSAEFSGKTNLNVIHLMDEQKDSDEKGGTMRLGTFECKLRPGTRTKLAYGEDIIQERHRHRYEFNNHYRNSFEENGMLISGLSTDGRLVEMIELLDHQFYVACQFHPEFKSRPLKPHPLFREFIRISKLK